jgi:hypothetical protein
MQDFLMNSDDKPENDVGLQRELQRVVPTGDNGIPDGPSPAGPQTGPVAGQADGQTGPSDAQGTHPGALGPDSGPDQTSLTDPTVVALMGEPNSLQRTFCKVCQTEVQPIGKGRCPRCQTFLRLNFVARRHPVNRLRCEQLFDQLVADYQPSTTLLRATCTHLSVILEQLEAMRPGSPDHQRLVQLSQLLGESLETSRTARESRDAAPSDTITIRRVLVEPEDDLTVEQLQARISRAQQRIDALMHPGAVSQDTPTIDATTPRKEPTCNYCHQALWRCREIKETDLDTWETLHHDDPEMIEQRAKRDTAEMIEAWKRQRHGDPNIR